MGAKGLKMPPAPPKKPDFVATRATPHAASVARPKPPPHAATLPKAGTLQSKPVKEQRPPHPATVRPARAPHPAAVAQPRRSFGNLAQLSTAKPIARHRAPLSERDLTDAVAAYQRQTEALVASTKATQAILQPSGLRPDALYAGLVSRPGQAIQLARGSNRGLMGEKEAGVIGEFWNFASQISSFMVNAPVPLTM